MKNGRLQCKDIETKPILQFLYDLKGILAIWYPGYERSVCNVMPKGIPEKLIRAKMKQLIRNGLVAGCDCGCRGDYEITEKGLLEILNPFPAIS